MSINDSLFECLGALGGVAFISSTPICTHSIGASGQLEIKIANLKLTNQASYNLEIYGLINGPASVTNQIDASIG
jgi:hypothetical protein